MARSSSLVILVYSHLRNILLLSVLALLILCLLYRIFRAAFSPLRHIPGPYVARFTRLWYLWQVVQGDFEKTNIQLHRKYGSIIRIAPNEYSINDPEAVKIIYGHGSKFLKAPWYIASSVPGKTPRMNLFADTNAERHAENRRKVANLYNMTTLIKMESAVNDCVEVIKRRFNEFSGSKQSIDMHHWLQCYAFDVIGQITVSRRFGFLEKGEDIDKIMRSIHFFLQYCAVLGLYNEWHSLLFGVVAAFGFRGMSHVITFAQTQIHQRSRLRENNTEKEAQEGDFLAKTLALHRDAPERFAMTDVLSVCASNIGAGSDTTGISLSSILYFLVKNPYALRKLRKEIAEGITNGSVSDPISFQDAQKLPYLQAIIKESLRLHPATGLPLARVVPPGGATISREAFPAGTVLGINTWVAHSNASIFGADVDIFRPERWLESDEKTSQMNRYWMPFGSGSRTCIGKNISLLEISKLIPELVRHYDFELVGMDKGLKTRNIWFVKQTNFHCRISRRQVLVDDEKTR